MIGKSVVLDTNIVVAHFRSASEYDEHLQTHELYLPQVVVAELYAGALRSNRPAFHQENIEVFLRSVTVLASNLETAKRYGKIWADLASRGSMIPQNDIWIGALALQHEMPLISNDAHFDHISGLELGRW